MKRVDSMGKKVAGPDIPRPPGVPPTPAAPPMQAILNKKVPVPKPEPGPGPIPIAKMAATVQEKGYDMPKSTEAKQDLRPERVGSSSSLRAHEYNFSAASSRDNIVFGAERPGYVHPTRELPSTPRGPDVTASTVTKWMNHMYDNGIRRALCLLNPDELKFYSSPLPDTLKQRFDVVSFIDISPTKTDCPLPRIMKALRDAENSNEGIVVFCSTGQGRTAYVLALWLHQRYNISIDDAVSETANFAQVSGTTRKASVESVLRLLLGPSEAALPSMSSLSIGTPRVDKHLHISFVQTGGTIDKDYPKIMNGSGFEIGDAASKRILFKTPTSFTYDNVSVCKKDSQEMTDKDREVLLETISKIPGKRIIVTHGTDTMLETAQYLRKSAIANTKTVLLTGAMKPERMVDSDATFNIGCAVGAMNVLGAGVYICMNGKVMDASSCWRDGKTGQFVDL